MGSIANSTGTDQECEAPMVADARKRCPEIRAASFDRGFHSQPNLVELDKMLERDALPKKGLLNEAELARETAPEFAR